MTTKMEIANAFNVLNNEGIIAKENFTCCQSCGRAKLANEYPDGTKIVFYHEQDYESSFVKSTRDNDEEEYIEEETMLSDLHLSYGILNNDDDDLEKSFAQVVISIVQNCGLKVQWNGSILTRIKVKA